jgi:hypothetical protein
MLKFFRTIHKKLIEQENIRKYLLYAIGEILLVVIGKLCPVRDYLSVETITPTASHRAVRYGICGNLDIDVDTAHMAYLTARSSFFAFYFLPICSPYGTDNISEIPYSLYS